MLQAPVFLRLAFDPFSLQQDCFAASKVDVGGCEIAEALVVTVVIVVTDEVSNLRFQVTWQIVVFEQDAVFERLVPALDPSLCHRMIGRTADVAHVMRDYPSWR